MATARSESWVAFNRRRLVAELLPISAALQTFVDSGQRAKEAPPVNAEESESALDELTQRCGLSCFERQLLLLCAGVEFDANLALQCGAAQGDDEARQPTFGLALAALPGAHWDALPPESPLRYYGLIELDASVRLTSSPLRISERVLHHLTGLSYLEPRLRGLLSPLTAEATLPDSQRAIAERIAALLTSDSPPPLIELCGSQVVGKQGIVAHAAALLGADCYVLRAADLPRDAAGRDSVCRLWQRETMLNPSLLLIAHDDAEDGETARALKSFLMLRPGPLLLSCRESLPSDGQGAVRFDVSRASPDEQHALWQAQLGPRAAQLNGQLHQLAGHFQLSHSQIAAAIAQSADFAAPPVEDGKDLAPRLWQAARLQARARLGEIAQRIEPSATWSDLVLPDSQRKILEEIAMAQRQRVRVVEQWGFGKRGSRGLGCSVLFAGPSGTGKTLSAEVLAGTLALDLYRIDLSQIISKYIGETEKNLRRIFEAAEDSGAVLLFDEADALFGKRSEIKDSHDRYANIEVSYLLQRMEAYQGLAILTSNMKSALDTAFVRRLRYIVQFPFPDVAQRTEIWRRAFPPDTPTEGLEPSRLGRLPLAGGNIRNVALLAAFLAADANQPVRMTHVMAAARSEYAKLDRPFPEAEAGGLS